MDHRGNETEAGFTDQLEISKPGTNPASGYLRVYAKSDGFLYTLNNAGVETKVGGGGSGGGASLALSYNWLTATTDVDPGSGNMSGDDPDPASATYIRISKTDANAHVIGDMIHFWFQYDGNVILQISSVADPNTFAVIPLNKIVDHSTWWDLFTGWGGALANNGTLGDEAVTIQFFPVVATNYELNAQISGPFTTTNTTGVMMGLGASPYTLKYKPNIGNAILITICGTIYNASGIGDGAKVAIRAGTGTAPANGAALTGSQYSLYQTYISSTTAGKVPFSLTTIIVPVVPNTQYWIDLSLAAITGGTAAISDLQVSAIELP